MPKSRYHMHAKPIPAIFNHGAPFAVMIGARSLLLLLPIGCLA